MGLLNEWYFWKDGIVQREDMHANHEERMSNCECYCYDPHAGSDIATWGMWRRPFDGEYSRRWRGMGKQNMPKEFLLSLLVMGINT